MMKKILFYIIGFSSLFSLQAKENAFAVWQGFEHKWMYNHRLNRLGDYIAQAPFQKFPHPYTAAHTGATGLGKDTASFRSYFATVKTKDIDFFAGVENFKLTGKQGDLYQVTKRILIVNAALAAKLQLAVIYNGMDLLSQSGADKLQLLKIQFSDPVRLRLSDTIELTIQAAIIVDCKSFECNRFNRQFRYELNIHYLVLGGGMNSMHITNADYNESVIWSRQKTSPETVFDKTIHGNPGFKNAILTFKNTFIVLNHDHWILSYANAITRSDYNASNGTMQIQHISYIRQWEEGMKQISSQSKFSEKRPGWGMLQGTMQLIQFNNGSVSYFERYGNIAWGGDNENANNEQSVNSENREIK